jgi:hypothetical protein
MLMSSFPGGVVGDGGNVLRHKDIESLCYLQRDGEFK